MSRLVASPIGGHDTVRPLASPIRTRPIRLTALGTASFVCGATIGVRLDFVGDLYLLEPLVALLALQCVLARGVGKNFVAPVFLGFVAAGLVTLCGYLLADLLAANEPWQYLKGWGRVIFLIVDSAALMVLAAHGRQNLWWLVLGMGCGGILSLLIEGMPLSKFKLGYAEYMVMLVVTLAPLASPVVAIGAIGAFGGLCIALDYRSLGAACILVAGAMVWQSMKNKGPKLAAIRGVTLVVIFAAAITLLASLLESTQEDYRLRRDASNVGRYVGVLVAWRAILESPFVGYGSWAVSGQNYTRMIRDEVLSRTSNPDMRRYAENHPVRSLMPHSQLIQVWLEAGILGLAFFVLYGAEVARALHFLVIRQPLDAIAPMFVFFLVEGIWNLIASPFLGTHRIAIAVAVAITMLAACQRNLQRHSTRQA